MDDRPDRRRDRPRRGRALHPSAAAVPGTAPGAGVPARRAGRAVPPARDRPGHGRVPPDGRHPAGRLLRLPRCPPSSWSARTTPSSCRGSSRPPPRPWPARSSSASPTPATAATTSRPGPPTPRCSTSCAAGSDTDEGCGLLSRTGPTGCRRPRPAPEPPLTPPSSSGRGPHRLQGSRGQGVGIAGRPPERRTSQATPTPTPPSRASTPSAIRAEADQRRRCRRSTHRWRHAPVVGRHLRHRRGDPVGAVSALGPARRTSDPEATAFIGLVAEDGSTKGSTSPRRGGHHHDSGAVTPPTTHRGL